MKPEQLTPLVQTAERKFGRVLKTPSDFEAFSDTMERERLSPTTLKRIWGYNTDHTDISISSANTLSRHLGYKDYDDFLKTSTLESHEQKVVYAASQIAKWSDALHSDRLDKAYSLLLEHRYGEAKELFADDKITKELEILCRDLAPFVDSVRTLVAEFIVKAHIVWACNWEQKDSMVQIENIYKQALPLAEAINDHNLLWNIYQDWAFKLNQHGDINEALELYHKAHIQGQILELENPEDYPVYLVSAVNDFCMILCDLEHFEEAAEYLERMIKYDTDTIADVYIKLNYARTCFELGDGEKAVDYYMKAAEKAAEFINEDITNHEVLHAFALAMYNLGVLCEEQDTRMAIDYYKDAINAFEAQDIPNILHWTYYIKCQERLEELLNQSES